MRAPRKALFVALFILAIITQPVLAINDYGEDEDYLGQIVDDYINGDNVSAAYNVINNETLGCMELNYSSYIEGALENFTNYIEVDQGNDITITDHTITIIGQPKNADGHVYRDMGAGYFSGDYDFKIALKITYGHVDSVYDWFACVSNEIGDYQDVSSFQGVYLRRAGSGALYRLGLWDKGGVGATYYAISINTMYYVNFSRIGNDLYLHIHSDEARTNLLQTLHFAGVQTTSWRYLYGTMARDATSGTITISTYAENLDIGRHGGGGYVDGEYYTTEMLDGDIALALMYNSTIPENCGITMEFSDDNSTWVDHNDAGGSDTLIAGFEALDLRDLNTSSLYVRTNMTTNGIDTPRIYQLRLVTITEVELGEGDTYLTGSIGIFLIVLIIIIPIAFFMVKRR